MQRIGDSSTLHYTSKLRVRPTIASIEVVGFESVPINYAKISFTTRAGSTPISRWSRPWNLYENRIGSKPKQMQDRGVQIVDVDAILRGVEAEVVALAERDAGLDAAAGQPHRESIRMVVAAVVAAALHHRRAAELAAPDDERIVQAGRAASGLSPAPRWPGPSFVQFVLMSCTRLPCWSHASWKISTNRTPRSTSRRASRHVAANDGLPGSAPYILRMCSGSCEISIASGAWPACGTPSRTS